MSGWLYLILAIMFEVIGTTSMKLSNGFTKIVPSIAMFIFYLLSLVALTYVLKKIEVSMAYAIWSGVGTALITLIGIYLFKEQISFLKIVSILLIIAGVVGLHIANKNY
jgi:small multidrug resistance pump